ncbi:MAG: GIY-YIG nuclease family protein [Parcubacteria group bacterium]|nr:GIY-YIG nuclease family protein [Parcubacteria group bacterium]
MSDYKVYILKSEVTSKYYIGCTFDLERRVLEHNNGRVKSTKSGRPWLLVYKELFTDLSNARVRESQIKGWKKRIMIERLINNKGAFV